MNSTIIKTSELEIKVNEARTAMATAYSLILNSVYESLYRIAYESTKDSEAAKDIVGECFSNILEEGLKSFSIEAITGLLYNQTKKACSEYTNEIHAKMVFQQVQNQATHSDNNNEEEIIKAALEAYNKLPEDRKNVLKETILNGSPAKEVGLKYKLDRVTVHNMNRYSLEMIRKLLFSKI